MKKIVKNIFIILLLSLLSALAYVSTIGIETEKFNSNISSQIKQLNSNLDIKLNQVNIKIDLFSFQIIAKTIGADLIYEDRILEIQNIKSKISLKSLIEKRFSLSEILISTPFALLIFSPLKGAFISPISSCKTRSLMCM